MTGGEAPRFDTTLSVMLHSVFIEPPPYGYTAMSDKWDIKDHWSGLPTMFIVSGWEGIDVLTHQALGGLVDKEHSPVDYAMRVDDLLPPETYWGYLALGQMAMGPPIVNDRWQYLWAWMETPQYKALLEQTPPFPCWDCLRFNPRSEYAPKRPPGPWPTGPEARWPAIWREYKQQCQQIYRLIEKATEEYEAMRYGSRKLAATIRKRRVKAHNAKLEALKYADYDTRAREHFLGIKRHRGMTGARYLASLRRQRLIS